MENIVVTNNTTTNVVIVKSLKSPGISILLTLLFGSLGMFYSTISGGLIMTFIVPPFMLFLLFAGKWIALFWVVIIYFPVCTIWGYNATKNYNKALLLEAKPKVKRSPVPKVESRMVETPTPTLVVEAKNDPSVQKN